MCVSATMCKYVHISGALPRKYNWRHGGTTTIAHIAELRVLLPVVAMPIEAEKAGRRMVDWTQIHTHTHNTNKHSTCHIHTFAVCRAAMELFSYLSHALHAQSVHATQSRQTCLQPMYSQRKIAKLANAPPIHMQQAKSQRESCVVASVRQGIWKILQFTRVSVAASSGDNSNKKSNNNNTEKNVTTTTTQKKSVTTTIKSSVTTATRKVTTATISSVTTTTITISVTTTTTSLKCWLPVFAAQRHGCWTASLSGWWVGLLAGSSSRSRSRCCFYCFSCSDCQPTTFHYY